VYIGVVAHEDHSGITCGDYSLSHKYGLRMVGTLEALKGLAVLVLCLALLSLLHQDLNSMVDRLMELLRINPDSHIADIFYEMADRTTGRGIWTAFTVGLLYSACRFVEGYGLWHQRLWAEWFAVISGAIYLPLEIYTLIAHPHWTKLVVLVINIGVVLYILRIMLEHRKSRCTPDPPTASKS